MLAGFGVAWAKRRLAKWDGDPVDETKAWVWDCTISRVNFLNMAFMVTGLKWVEEHLDGKGGV